MFQLVLKIILYSFFKDRLILKLKYISDKDNKIGIRNYIREIKFHKVYPVVDIRIVAHRIFFLDE